MLIIGLTGSIGTGKSTIAKMFGAHGIPVYDADAAVHALYNGGAAVAAVEKEFPGTSVNGVIDRQKLSILVLGDQAKLKKLEAIVHPLVHESERAFIAAAQAAGHRQVILEIPLLFETKGTKRCDILVVTSVAPDIQRERVLARPGMTSDKFEAILGKQMPDSEKRRRAHFIVDTGTGMEASRKQVSDIVRALYAVRSHQAHG
jgi:dephospho-CoA kinase